jgi:uncharacterized membrane protein YidH (DUF202 family)
MKKSFTTPVLSILTCCLSLLALGCAALTWLQLESQSRQTTLNTANIETLAAYLGAQQSSNTSSGKATR